MLITFAQRLLSERTIFLIFTSQIKELVRGCKLLLLLIFFSNLTVNAQYVFVPDTAFALYIKSISLTAVQGNRLDTNNVRIRSLKQLEIQNANIKDLTGIQYFDSLQTLKAIAKIKRVPVLPPCIKELKIGNQIDTLEIYSSTLKSLDVSNNKIVSIIHVPAGVEKLYLVNNQLHDLNNVGDSLVELDANSNLIDTLDVQSPLLNKLYVSHNSISFIQHLPDSLLYLDISRNQLSYISNLPPYLKSIILDADPLLSVNNLPSELEYLSLKGCGLTSFPDSIPASVNEIDISSNYLDTIICIPSFLKSLTAFGNNISWIGSINDSLRYLDLRYNLLGLLPPLKNLETLFCTSNPLICLPRLPETLSTLQTSLACIPNQPAAMTLQYPLCHLKFDYIENNIIPASCADDTLKVVTNASRYLWNSGDTLSYLANACRNFYSCETIDSNNCYRMGLVDLTGSLNAYIGSYAYACDNCLEFAEITVTGGTPPYTYDWDFDNGSVANGNQPGVRRICGLGTLTCKVKDALMDSTETSFFIPTDASDGFYTTVINPSCDVSFDGYILITKDSSGIPVFVYEVSHAGPGHYDFPVSTYFGCVDTISIDLTADEICYNATVNYAECGKCNGSLTAVLNGANWNSNVVITIEDTAGNIFMNHQLCINQTYIAQFNINDGINSELVYTDTLLMNDLSCTAVYPGDANNDGVANNLDLLSIGIAYGDTGVMRTDTTIAWSPHYVTDWSNTFADSTNHKHADSDGNGVINGNDTSAILMNYSFSYDSTALSPPIAGVPSLFVNMPDTLEPETAYNVQVMLGSNTDTVSGIYGLAFSIIYDPAMIELNCQKFTVDSNWLGVNGGNLIYLQQEDTLQGKIDAVMTGIDHADRTGFGAIGTLKFKTKKFFSEQSLQIAIAGITAIDHNENLLQLNAGIDSAVINPVNCTMNISVSSSNSCSNWCGAYIELQVADPVDGLHYDWSQSVFDTTYCIPSFYDTDQLSGLPSGTYKCIIIDSIGCRDTVEVSVFTDGNTLEATANFQYEGCITCNGFIDLSVTGGYAPYQYDWSNSGFIGNNSDTAEDLTDLCFYFNTFLCNITDSIGCTTQYYLEGPICGFNYQIDVMDETCPGNNDGSITLSGNNFPTFCPFGFIHANDTGMVDINGPVVFDNLTAGIYPVTLISPNTCDTVFAQVTVNHLPEPVVQVQTVTPHCGYCDGIATVLIDSSTSGTFQNFWWALSGNTITTDSNLCADIDYEYNFNDLNSCLYTGVVNLGCDSTTGINSHSPDNNGHLLMIIPNPNNGTFTILLSKSFNEPALLSISNSLGDCVYKYFVADRIDRIAIDESRLPAGLYLCRLVSNGTTTQVSFIKQ